MPDPMGFDHVGFNPRGGDHRSTPGRFGPLAVDHPSVGNPCIICGMKMEVGDIPSLISLAPDGVKEAHKKELGKPYNAIGGIAHQSCTWPGEART